MIKEEELPLVKLYKDDEIMVVSDQLMQEEGKRVVSGQLLQRITK